LIEGATLYRVAKVHIQSTLELRFMNSTIFEEIEKWAYQAHADEPQQDFDLLLSNEPHDLYLDLAADLSCPKHQYFLSVLYLIVGDAVRTNYQTQSQKFIEQYLAKGKQRQAPLVNKWVDRSQKLMFEPEKFDYEDWCGGKLAYKRSNSDDA
jgi:hypothetical protein